MELKIDGNPGTGNSFTEIIIQSGGVNNNNQSGVTVTNITNIYNNGKALTAGGDMDDREKQIIKTAILEFVGKLKTYVAPTWVDKYDTLWVSILALPEVDAMIYDKGRLQNTLFNRALVGGIVKILMDKGVFVDSTSPTELAPLIDAGGESFRKEMGKYPPEEIQKAVKELIDKH